MTRYQVICTWENTFKQADRNRFAFTFSRFEKSVHRLTQRTASAQRQSVKLPPVNLFNLIQHQPSSGFAMKFSLLWNEQSWLILNRISARFHQTCFLQSIKKERSQVSFNPQTMHAGKSANMLIMFAQYNDLTHRFQT